MSDRSTDWHIKPPSKVRSVQDALASSERRRNDLPHVVQVYAADWDEVILADHIAEIKRQRDAAVEALKELAAEEWRDDDDPILRKAREKTRAILREIEGES